MNNPRGSLFIYDYFYGGGFRVLGNIEFNFYREYSNKSLQINDTLGKLICSPTVIIKNEPKELHQIKYNEGAIEITNINDDEIGIIYNYLGNKTIELKKSYLGSFFINKSDLDFNMVYILIIYSPTKRNKITYKIINNY